MRHVTQTANYGSSIFHGALMQHATQGNLSGRSLIQNLSVEDNETQQSALKYNAIQCISVTTSCYANEK